MTGHNVVSWFGVSQTKHDAGVLTGTVVVALEVSIASIFRVRVVILACKSSTSPNWSFPPTCDVVLGLYVKVCVPVLEQSLAMFALAQSLVKLAK